MISLKLAWHDLLFYLPKGKLKTLMNFNNSYVLFCLFMFLCLNKQNIIKSVL